MKPNEEDKDLREEAFAEFMSLHSRAARLQEAMERYDLCDEEPGRVEKLRTALRMAKGGAS